MSRVPRPNDVTRREFVRAAAASAGALATAGVVFTSGCGGDQEMLAPEVRGARGGVPGPPVGGGGGGGSSTRNPLFVPHQVGPGGLNLHVGPAQVDLGDGVLSSAWVYDGGFGPTLPGPTVVAATGDRATIALTNGLVDPTITHWHGMVIDGWQSTAPGNDGHPLNAIPSGGVFSYDFPIVQRAAMNWYHPHPHGRTGEQVALGQAGAFIIRDAEESGLGLPAGSPYEVPLILRDTKLDKDGNLTYHAKKSGFEGNLALVNGTRDAMLVVDRAIYRFRILNGANARIFYLALGNGASLRLIGNDGGLLPQHVDLKEIVISPAERVDVLVDFSGLAQDQSVALQDLNSGWDLVEFVGSGSGTGGALPTVNSAVPMLTNPVTTRHFAFEGMSRINGQEFEMDRVDFTVPHGVTERWVFSTAGNAPHPVHVHASPFQIKTRSGGRGCCFPWEGGWKDTVLLEDGETVEIFVRFDAPEIRGRYLMHCHKLEHEDAGMMLNFEVG